MLPDRRQFLKQAGYLAAAGSGVMGVSSALANGHPQAPEGARGALVDLTECVGCRLCEHACKKADGIDPGPLESYNDQSVFSSKRRPGPIELTVLNSWPGADDKPVYAKINCMHCNHAACVSACIVGALEKQPNGSVTYDAWKCIGCRYCMVACPFQVPAYEYDDAFTPRVRKCDFCHERTTEGKPPACVEACPRQVMVYGKRTELIALAHERIAKHPERYVNHVYGEHEVGGTSWMYLSPVPFEQAGFMTLGTAAPPALTEAIQHGVFKYWLVPAGLFGVLGALMWATSRKHDGSRHGDADSNPGPGAVSHKPDPVVYDAAPAHGSLNTPGVWALLVVSLFGVAVAVYRFLFGLTASTNLDQQHPWGLWIAVDVASGVALAAGGFTSAFLAHVLHRHQYEPIVKPALLTAALGYTFVVLGLLADLGRYYNVWHPLFLWNGNSVLFEVGMCVMCYLNVLYLEFAPIVCQRLAEQRERYPRLARLAVFVDGKLARLMFLLVIAGCVLSCLHQSSLGNLMVIAPSKQHPLWWTPLSPLLFLLSAIAVGYPMIIWESLVAGWSLKHKPEMTILTPLARFVPFTLGLYLAVKLGDLIYRQAYVHLAVVSPQSICWLLEIVGGVVVPMLLMMSRRVRQSPGALLLAATLVILGVVFNRVNAFLIGYQPPYAVKTYIPALSEFALTAGLVATLMLLYRLAVTYLPILPRHEEVPA